MIKLRNDLSLIIYNYKLYSYQLKLTVPRRDLD